MSFEGTQEEFGKQSREDYDDTRSTAIRQQDCSDQELPGHRQVKGHIEIFSNRFLKSAKNHY